MSKKIVYVWGLLSVSRRIFHGRRDLWYVKASNVVFLSHGLCSETIVFQTRKIALGLWTLLWNDGHQSLLGSLLLNNTCKKSSLWLAFSSATMKRDVIFCKMPKSPLLWLEIAKISNDHNKEGGDLDYCSFNVTRFSSNALSQKWHFSTFFSLQLRLYTW